MISRPSLNVQNKRGTNGEAAKFSICRAYVARATARAPFVKAHADEMVHFAAADAA